MSESATAITNLIYTYAELIDGGDLDGLAGLFEHGRICGVENGPPETVFAGTARVREMYDMATRMYEDGTPKTHHNTTNVRLDIDEAAGTARSTSYYCVTQATPDLPLQVVVAPGITRTPFTAATVPGGSTAAPCSSTRSAMSATT